MGVPEFGYQLFDLRKRQTHGWVTPRSQNRPRLKLSVIEADIYDAGQLTIECFAAAQEKENICRGTETGMLLDGNVHALRTFQAGGKKGLLSQFVRELLIGPYLPLSDVRIGLILRCRDHNVRH